MPCAARAPRRAANRLRAVPAALAPRSPALVRAMRPTGATFWTVPPVHEVAGCPRVGAIGHLAHRGGAAGRVRAEVRRAAAHRRRFGGGHGGAPASCRRTGGASSDSARDKPAAPARLQSERAPGACAHPRHSRATRRRKPDRRATSRPAGQARSPRGIARRRGRPR